MFCHCAKTRFLVVGTSDPFSLLKYHCKCVCTNPQPQTTKPERKIPTCRKRCYNFPLSWFQNMSSMGSPLFNSSAQPQMDTLTSGNFQHMDFIHLWFQAKLRPVLPSVSADFLSCLSTRNFSCQSYQALCVYIDIVLFIS